MGRPTKYNDKICRIICMELMIGKSLRKICERDDIPTIRTVCRWLADEEKHPEFCQQYARARAIQAELLVDELHDIADDAANDYIEKTDADGNVVGLVFNKEHVQRSRLRVDTRKWTASKLLPKRYGERTQVDMNVSVDLTQKLNAAKKRLEKLASEDSK